MQVESTDTDTVQDPSAGRRSSPGGHCRCRDHLGLWLCRPDVSAPQSTRWGTVTGSSGVCGHMILYPLPLSLQQWSSPVHKSPGRESGWLIWVRYPWFDHLWPETQDHLTHVVAASPEGQRASHELLLSSVLLLLNGSLLGLCVM